MILEWMRCSPEVFAGGVRAPSVLRMNPKGTLNASSINAKIVVYNTVDDVCAIKGITEQ
jgi:hypothetical protein